LAEDHYKEAINIDPLYAEAQNAYGVFLCKHARYKEADQHFNKALKNPIYRTPQLVYANAGYCAYQSKQNSLAEAYLRKALQIQPTNSVALYHMAALSYDTQKFLRARAYLQRYHDVVKPSPKSLMLGINIENRLGDKDAIASYKLLLKSEFPDSDEAGKVD
jgi:type IV pilus assembly protein PilF